MQGIRQNSQEPWHLTTGRVKKSSLNYMLPAFMKVTSSDYCLSLVYSKCSIKTYGVEKVGAWILNLMVGLAMSANFRPIQMNRGYKIQMFVVWCLRIWIIMLISPTKNLNLTLTKFHFERFKWCYCLVCMFNGHSRIVDSSAYSIFRPCMEME